MKDGVTATDLERRLAAAEAALREKHEEARGLAARHDLLIASWAQAVWETDAAGVVVADSPTWRAYTGQTLEEWLGDGWLSAIHPDERAYARRQWLEAVAVGGLVNAEFRLQAPDGGWRWTNVRAAPVLDAGGAVENWVGLNIDIDERKHAEAALRESEERLQLALEATDLAVYEWDLASDGLTTNERFRTLMGIAADEPIIGARVLDACVDPDDRARVDSELASAMHCTSGGKFAFEHRLGRIGPLGAPWVLSRGQVYFSGSGDTRRPVRVFGTLQDVTSRKLADIAVRESEGRQAFLLQLSDALRAEPDADAVANRALALLSGHLQLDRCYITCYRPADDEADVPYQLGNETVPPLPAKVRLSDFPEAYERLLDRTLVIEDDVERRGLSEVERANSKALGLRAIVASTVRRGEKRPLASMAAVSSRPRRWSSAEIALVEEAAERTWGAIAHSRAEAALRESEERFQQFARASSAGLWIRDAETMAMEFVSPAMASIYGIAPEALLGDVTLWAAMIVPDDRDAALARLEAACRGETVVYEFRVQRPSDGAFRWIRNTDFPLHDDGRIPRIGGVAEDVSDTRLAAEHSAVLLAELQHRVRNTMALLRSITHRTAERSVSVPEYRELLVGRLLAFARVQALLTRSAAASVGIASVVRDEVGAQAQHESQYVLEGPDIPLSPKAAEVLTLVIHELATNAVKYGALATPHGRVAVRWSIVETPDGPWLAFDWTEDGAPARPPPAFNASRRRGFGSELIEERVPYELRGRGKVRIEPGGARCHLEFPLLDGASILETAAPQRATVFGGAMDMTGEPDLTGLRVLVVEDDYYLATDAARALRGAGADVMGPCATEEIARAALAERRPDAAVVDINLGSGPSFTLAEALKVHGIPFVFTTGYDAEAIPSAFEEVERLEKPIQLRQIIGAVARLTTAR